MIGEIPKDFVEEHLPNAEGSLMFGAEITKLNRDELLSIIVFLNKYSDEQREQHSSDLEFLSSCHRKAGSVITLR